MIGCWKTRSCGSSWPEPSSTPRSTCCCDVTFRIRASLRRVPAARSSYCAASQPRAAGRIVRIAPHRCLHRAAFSQERTVVLEGGSLGGSSIRSNAVNEASGQGSLRQLFLVAVGDGRCQAGELVTTAALSGIRIAANSSSKESGRAA